MEKKCLAIHVPVIHKGYLDFLNDIKDQVSSVFILDANFVEGLSSFKPDIAAINANSARDLLEKMGFRDIFTLSKNDVGVLRNREMILVNDEVSRSLANKYLDTEKIEWKNVFLRWDRTKVLALEKLDDIPVSKEKFDIDVMKEAIKESEKTGDWWRQIGAMLVKDKQIILKAFNKDLPSDYTPYQVGEVRDLFAPGERHDLANTIHAEQNIISLAAKKGISTDGLALYVTTFPCPVCAKLIAVSGIKNVFYNEGGSNFDAKKVLKSADVKITKVMPEIKPSKS